MLHSQNAERYTAQQVSLTDTIAQFTVTGYALASLKADTSELLQFTPVIKSYSIRLLTDYFHPINLLI